MSEEPLYILSDSEDELHLRVNSEHISLKKPTTDEIVPDSEGESESLPLISYTPPRQRHQLEQPNAHLSSPLSSIPSHSKRKDDYSQEIPKAKKMKQAKSHKAKVLPEDTFLIMSNPQAPQSSSQPRSSPPRPRPKPRPKAKPKKQAGGSETTPESTSTSPSSQPETHVQPSPPHSEVELQLQEPPPPRSPFGDKIFEFNQHHGPNIQPEEAYIPKPKPNVKEKKRDSREEEKENSSPSPPKNDTSLTSVTPPTNQYSSPLLKDTPLKDTSQTMSIPTPSALLPFSNSNKKNRPLSDILREMNQTRPRPRFSPAVSRNFLSRIAPLHPNRRKPPPSPPRIIPKKTKKEIKMEEKWEEELQDSIPDWCQLTEEERSQYRRQKRDWELGLCED